MQQFVKNYKESEIKKQTKKEKDEEYDGGEVTEEKQEEGANVELTEQQNVEQENVCFEDQ